MRVPISWLNDFVPIQLSVEEIARRLTIAGIEVGQIETSEAEGESDQVLVLDILPNIARCQSIVGVAREVGALTQQEGRLTPPLWEGAIERSDLDPEIEVPELCQRFSVAVAEGIEVKESPGWIRRRLLLGGMEPINNVVDAANYVMLELGQPMHTYDADRLPSRLLGVRLAREGESLLSVIQEAGDEPTRLSPGTLLITSDDRPVAIAGLLGGLDTAITDDTRTIEIESANFDFLTIRRTQSALKLFSEASSRFSRGVDPALTVVGVRRLLHLLAETCPALRVTATGDRSYVSSQTVDLELTLTEINDSLGVKFTSERVTDTLKRIGISAEARDGRIQVSVPSSRRDISLNCDVIEEVGRLNGYEALPATMPLDPIPMHRRNRHLELREAARDAMVRWGLQEIISYSLTDPESERALWSGREGETEAPAYVKLLNPISSERTVMRRSLIPGLLQTLHLNLKHSPACYLFEIGSVFLPECGSPPLPAEPYRLALAMTGPVESASVHRSEPRECDYYDLRDAVESILRHLHVGPVRIESAETAPFQPGACGVVKGDAGQIFGYLGAVHPAVARRFDLEGRKILCADLDLEAIIKESRRFFGFVKPALHPSIELDLSVLVKRDLAAGDLVEMVSEAGPSWLQNVTIFDVYQGKGISPDRKAVGLRLEFNGGDRTLTTEEASSARAQILSVLEQKVGAQAR